MNNWNQFIIENNGSFLQSFEWSQFQKSLGRKIWLIEIDSQLKGLVIKNDLPFSKNYLYCPRGPIGNFSLADFQKFLEEIRRIGEEEKSIFFKIEPDKDFELGQGFIPSQKQIQPNRTIILEIDLPEEDLLNQMHHKTRYNIRLAERKGIKIEKNNRPEAFNKFLKLLSKTAKRDNFYLHPKEYYQMMFNQGIAELFTAKYNNRIIAANLISFFNKTAVYMHGASDYQSRNLMAPYLLQWQIILEAKKKGFKYYDFWGIDEKRWPGVTRFKKGFKNEETIYPGAFDLILRKNWYRVYKIARKIF